ncbi:hypothetical protein [Escherichia coli]|nr:hypothetical protein [Escherichia coli]
MNRESVWNIEPVTHDEKPNNPTGCDGGEPDVNPPLWVENVTTAYVI